MTGLADVDGFMIFILVCVVTLLRGLLFGCPFLYTDILSILVIDTSNNI